MTKRYGYSYTRKKLKKKFGFGFLCLAIVFGIIISLNIADIISSLIIGKGSIFYNGSFEIPSKTFYAISAGSFKEKSKANLFAESVKQKGGAGYVYLNGDYYVLLSMYSSQLDANSVKEKLKQDDIVATIININIPKLKISFEKKDEKLTTLSKEFLNTFNFLYELTINYDSGNTDYESCIKEINKKVNELNYVSTLSPESKEGLLIKEKAIKMINSLKTLVLCKKDGYAFNSMLKETYFKIVFEYILLCKEIS